MLQFCLIQVEQIFRMWQLEFSLQTFPGPFCVEIMISRVIARFRFQIVACRVTTRLVLVLSLLVLACCCCGCCLLASLWIVRLIYGRSGGINQSLLASFKLSPKIVGAIEGNVQVEVLTVQRVSLRRRGWCLAVVVDGTEWRRQLHWRGRLRLQLLPLRQLAQRKCCLRGRGWIRSWHSYLSCKPLIRVSECNISVKYIMSQRKKDPIKYWYSYK